MDGLFRFSEAQRNNPAVRAWFMANDNTLVDIAELWFRVIEGVADDVWSVLHDGYPTACCCDVAFAYVGVFKAHVNVGFFRGAELPDPDALLTGTGKRMRHVKLRRHGALNEAALRQLIVAAYEDMRQRVEAIS
ncbi:MAG: DUF1801 domain-containing protein [Pseudomonadota bacterium]